MLCALKNIRPLLQVEKYEYYWYRSSKMRIIQGKLKYRKLNKKDGYQVALFISVFMNDHSLNLVGHLNFIENKLHSDDFIHIDSWDGLVKGVESKLLSKNKFIWRGC